MNILKQNYRELSKNPDFFINKRFIFNEAAAKQPEAKDQSSVPAEEPQGPAKDLTKSEFDKHSNQFKEKLEKLKKAYQIDSTKDDAAKQVKEDVKQQNLDNLNTTFDITKKSYDANKKLIEDQYGVDNEKNKAKKATAIKEIEDTHTPEVKDLINKAQTHIADTKLTDTDLQNPVPEAKKATAAPKPGEPGPEIKTEIPLEKGKEKARTAFDKIFKQNWSQLKDAMGLIMPGVDAQQIKTYEQFIKNPYANKILNYFINNLDKDDLAKLEKGQEPQLNQKTIDLIQKAVRVALNVENLNDKADAEIALIKTLVSGDKTFEDFFGKDSKVPEILSRKYKIEANEGGGIKIDGKVVTDIKQLKNYVIQIGDKTSDQMGTQFDEILKGKKESLTSFDSLASKQNEVLISIQQGLDAAKDVTIKLMNREGTEKPTTPMEALIMIIKLFAAIKKAMESGDWDELGDYMDDWKQSNNPKEMAKLLKASQDAYKERLEKEPKPTLNQLLKSYVEPRGDDANALFLTNPPKGKERALTKHRSEAKPLIIKHLQPRLGDKVSVKNIEPGDGNQIKVTASKDNVKLSITVNPLADGKFTAKVQKLETEKVTENGKEVDKEKASDYIQGKGTEQSMNSLDDLKTFLDGGTTPESKQETETDEQKAEKKTRAEEIDKLTDDQLTAIKGKIDLDTGDNGLKKQYDEFQSVPPNAAPGAKTKQFLKQLDQAKYDTLNPKAESEQKGEKYTAEQLRAMGTVKIRKLFETAMKGNKDLKNKPEYQPIVDAIKNYNGAKKAAEKPALQTKINEARIAFLIANTTPPKK